jgi:hypothetical protein
MCSLFVVLIWSVVVLSGASVPIEFTGLGGEVLMGYRDQQTDTREALYSEAGGFFRFSNPDAVLGLNLSGRFYQRYQQLFEQELDQRYSLQTSIQTAVSRFQLGSSASVSRSLSSQTYYDPEAGQEPSEYLRDDPVTTLTASGNVSYRLPLSGKTSLIPQYSASYTKEDFSGISESRLMQMGVARVNYKYSERTGINGDFAVQRQKSQEEVGNTARASLGASWRYSSKTSFSGALGWMAAFYNKSGSAQSLYFNLRGLWQATDKTSLYCFGGSRFRPGTQGQGADKVWRLGYGGNWNPRDTWRVSLQMLHQFSKQIEDEGGAGLMRSDYLTAVVQKKINKYLAAQGSVSYQLSGTENRVSSAFFQLALRASF